MRLAVNIDHVATLREARGGIEPDPVHAAVLAELAGASGIVCHLREDRRHVNDRDVRVLRDVVTTKLDLEMAATPEIIGIALDIVPDLVTLVPERRETSPRVGEIQRQRRKPAAFGHQSHLFRILGSPETTECALAKEQLRACPRRFARRLRRPTCAKE